MKRHTTACNEKTHNSMHGLLVRALRNYFFSYTEIYNKHFSVVHL